MQLTTKAESIVARIRNHYEKLIGDGFTSHNATERVLHDNGNITIDLVYLALDMPYDRGALDRNGHTVRQ